MSTPGAAWQPGWHERFTVVRFSRRLMRAAFFKIVRAAFDTDEGRAILTDRLGDLLAWRPANDLSAARREAPYADLGRAPADGNGIGRRPVFITARFRSGSTLLWNLFRHIDGCTAYYEPFNERRWFDPVHRGGRIDATHRHVDNYWREYDGLAELASCYREDWIRRRLYMDERAWDPAMAAFVRLMIARAAGRPVLQFNRIDFRLAWFRHTFPEATIVHLYRHPRDQWCSTLPDLAEYPATATMADFAAHDHYYLRPWAADLKVNFPFLDEAQHDHAYPLFYYVWKLSYLFGVAHAHYSLSFEELVADPARALTQLHHAVGVEGADLSRLTKLVQSTPSRWRAYADDAWFRAHEERCEVVLQQFFETSGRERGSGPVRTDMRSAVHPALVDRQAADPRDASRHT